MGEIVRVDFLEEAGVSAKSKTIYIVFGLTEEEVFLWI